MAYSLRNIEDWDFRMCGIENTGKPGFDHDADYFLSTNYTTVLAVDAMRVQILHAFVKAGAASVDPAGNVTFNGRGEAFLAGAKSNSSRFTSEGRFERRVIEAMRREVRRDGRIKLSIMP